MSANSSHLQQPIGVRRCVANRAATGRRFARIRRNFASLRQVAGRGPDHPCFIQDGYFLTPDSVRERQHGDRR